MFRSWTTPPIQLPPPPIKPPPIGSHPLLYKGPSNTRFTTVSRIRHIACESSSSSMLHSQSTPRNAISTQRQRSLLTSFSSFASPEFVSTFLAASVKGSDQSHIRQLNPWKTGFFSSWSSVAVIQNIVSNGAWFVFHQFTTSPRLA